MSGEIARPVIRCRPWSPTRATLDLRAGVDELYELLADYDGWDEWAPGVETARSLAREGDLALVELGFAGEPEPTVLECVRATASELRMRRIGGPDGLQTLRWSFRPAGDDQVELMLDLRLPWRRRWHAVASRIAGRWLRCFVSLAAHRCEEFPLRRAGERSVLEVFDVGGSLEIRRGDAEREYRAFARDESA